MKQNAANLFITRLSGGRLLSAQAIAARRSGRQSCSDSDTLAQAQARRKGATIRVMAEGPDAVEALAALREAIEGGLEEAEETADVERIAWEGPTLTPVVTSRGMAVGAVWQFQRGKIVLATTARDSRAERTRLERAVESAKRELAELYRRSRPRPAPAGRRSSRPTPSFSTTVA
jgi:hypothetical protein